MLAMHGLDAVVDPAIGVGGRAAPPRPPTKNMAPLWTEILNYT